MTRIISGKAGSLTLEVPAAGTRPTSDRVRESLFSALESADVIRDASVLDLFAGSGALGLEAASRGATRVELVERSGPAAAIARRNAGKVVRALRGSCTVDVHAVSVATFLRRVAASGASGTFDVVFIDPPYDLADEDLSEALQLLVPLVHADATIVIERASRSIEPTLPEGLEHLRQKKYGDTTLWWVAPTPPRPVE